MAGLVTCPICSKEVPDSKINEHLDTGCAQNLSKASKRQVSGTQAGPSTLKKPTVLAPIFGAKQKVEASPSLSARGNKRHADSLASDGPVKRNKISHNLQNAAPLAERMRPATLSEFVGQTHLMRPDSLLRQSIARGSIGSLILWGPPGSGKTSLARLLARETNSVYKELSATIVGISEVRAVFEEAKSALKLTGRRTVLFLDEIHRFNKSQQDIFLPFVEQGHIQLVGATTENPSFKLTGALLSRCRVYVLERLTDQDISKIITSSLQRVQQTSTKQSSQVAQLPDSSPPASSWSSDTTTAPSCPLSSKVIATMVSLASGDARTALSLLELVLTASSSIPEADLLDSLRQSVAVSYDRTGESHYDMISALHKSVRGSDSDAAMYWLARMLTAGEDPLFVARRMAVCASEDIGLADNHALPLAMATIQACQTLGMPECRINLAHLVAYLAEAPKSTRAYEAYKRAEAKAKENPYLPVPMQVRNSPTKLMAELGYGQEYHYNPDYSHPVYNHYRPPEVENEVFLRPHGDMRDKIFDEKALEEWEKKFGKWEGRH
ncbi:P-loop containing nucleoside triphosphate hydrolase protein [Mycena floridula]|nr:P-loop containing nucleoside triphosphate hydrolase protein [Mycena floridula]